MHKYMYILPYRHKSAESHMENQFLKVEFDCRGSSTVKLIALPPQYAFKKIGRHVLEEEEDGMTIIEVPV